MIKAYAAHKPGGKLEPFEYDPGPLHAGEVEIQVEHCGICHSDISMLHNEWGMTEYKHTKTQGAATFPRRDAGAD